MEETYQLSMGHFPVDTLLRFSDKKNGKQLYLRVRAVEPGQSQCEKCAFHGTHYYDCNRLEAIGRLCYCSSACRADRTSIYFEALSRDEYDFIENNQNLVDRYFAGFQDGIRRLEGKITNDQIISKKEEGYGF